MSTSHKFQISRFASCASGAHLAGERCFLLNIIPLFSHLCFFPDISILGICPQHSKRFLRSLAKEKLLEAKHSGPRLCIDLSMTHHMSKKVEHCPRSKFLLTQGKSRREQLSQRAGVIHSESKCSVSYTWPSSKVAVVKNQQENRHLLV